MELPVPAWSEGSCGSRPHLGGPHHRAPKEPVGWDPLRRRGVAAPRLGQCAAKQPAAPGRPI